MRKSLIIGTVLVGVISTGAFAQTTTTTTTGQGVSEFYVVQDVSSKRCTIVDKKPTTTTSVVVGNGVFKTRTEAETGMKSIKVCESN